MTDINRRGRAELCFVRRGRRTILRRQYTTLPARVIRPFYPDDDGRAYVFLLTPTGGMLGGDEIDIRIILEAGAHVCLTSASATKVHPCIDLPARQSLTIELAAESSLEYLPEPTILFRDARWQQHTSVQRAPDSRLLLAEGWSAGRVARGEVFQFSSLDTRLEVMTASTLSLFDHMRLNAAAYPYQRLGLWGARPHLLSLYLLQEPPPVHAWLYELQTDPAMRPALLGVSQLQAGGVVIRALAADADAMARLYQDLWRRIRQGLWGEPWSPWRKW
jgi:urease accessory protein